MCRILYYCSSFAMFVLQARSLLAWSHGNAPSGAGYIRYRHSADLIKPAAAAATHRGQLRNNEVHLRPFLGRHTESLRLEMSRYPNSEHKITIGGSSVLSIKPLAATSRISSSTHAAAAVEVVEAEAAAAAAATTETQKKETTNKDKTKKRKKQVKKSIRNSPSKSSRSSPASENKKKSKGTTGRKAITTTTMPTGHSASVSSINTNNSGSRNDNSGGSDASSSSSSSSRRTPHTTRRGLHQPPPHRRRKSVPWWMVDSEKKNPSVLSEYIPWWLHTPVVKDVNSTSIGNSDSTTTSSCSTWSVSELLLEVRRRRLYVPSTVSPGDSGAGANDDDDDNDDAAAYDGEGYVYVSNCSNKSGARITTTTTTSTNSSSSDSNCCGKCDEEKVKTTLIEALQRSARSTNLGDDNFSSAVIIPNEKIAP